MENRNPMKKGQATIEFTYVVIVIFFLMYGLIRIFRWAGMDLAERRWANDQTFISPNGPFIKDSPSLTNVELRLTPDFYRTKRMNSVYRKIP